MQEDGISEKEVLKILGLSRRKDLKYSDGKILSSMCTMPHIFARKVYRFFLETNLGDAGLFKGTKELEDQSIKLLGSLLSNKDACGFIVSGGTEANLMALWVARNKAGKEKPEVVVSEGAHFSLEKASNLLGMKLIKARNKKDRSVDINDVKKNIGEKTVAIVASAGSTEYGTIDDVEALSEIALNEGIYLHVDAAFGGFVIPFLRDLGYEVRKFDFSLRGVSSITIDPHKMGLSVIPSGGILFRNRELLKYIETEAPYLTEKVQHTILGTRSGASAATTFSLLKLLGKKGYRDNVKKCMDRTILLYNELKELGMDVLKPTMNILVFNHNKADIISQKLAEKGWVTSRTRSGEIRLVIMPHIREENIIQFIEDLKDILKR
jgi:tyrosine decarboxylase/aspartate 1-decarboxylase